MGNKTAHKVVSVVGARPQFIKLAPLAPELAARFDHRVVHTGQHYDNNMSAVFFKQLAIPGAHTNLGIGGASHGVMTGRMLVKLEQYFQREEPDLVIVFGDTDTTLAGALAASKLAIPVAHVEAGMRSFVADMPEEINRRVADHLSSLLFCPTTAAVRNLRNEGIRGRFVSGGDLMYELLHASRPRLAAHKRLLKHLNLRPGAYAYLTFHRAANVDDPDQLGRLVGLLGDMTMPVVFSVHPRTKKRLRAFRLVSRLRKLGHVTLTEPLSYLDNLTLARHAHIVMTDSGGLQKEALFLGTPVLTLREETEWVETLRMGNRLTGLDRNKILASIGKPPTVKRIGYRVAGRKPSQIIAAEIGRFLRGR